MTEIVAGVHDVHSCPLIVGLVKLCGEEKEEDGEGEKTKGKKEEKGKDDHEPEKDTAEEKKREGRGEIRT